MASVSPFTEIEENSEAVVVRDDVVYVAVGNVVKEGELTLHWALQNCGGRKICIIHVLQLAQKIPLSKWNLMGSKFPITQLAKHQVKAFHDAERRDMQKVMEKYMLICRKAGMHAEKLSIEMDSIEKGIIELIHQQGIGKLVMGGAANKSHSRKMIEPKSKKAIYVRQHAPAFCHIWFVCKGHLIHTRESRIEEGNLQIVPQAQVVTPSTPTRQFSPSPSISDTRQTDLLIHPTPENSRIGSADYKLTPSNRSITDGSIDGWGGISRRTSSGGSQLSVFSSTEMVDNSVSISALKTERSGSRIDTMAPHYQYDHYGQLPLPNISEANGVDELHDRLQHFLADAETYKREAYEESIKRRKAEKEASDAIHRVTACESMYAEELNKRRETEEALAQEKEEVRRMQQRLRKIMKDLQIANDQNSSLESRVADSDQIVKDLEHKILSAVTLMQKLRKDRDELEVKRDNALRVADDLRKQKYAERASSSSNYQFVTEFSFSELEEATQNFNPALRIGEGGYGSIYKGLIRHTPVAIKMLNSNSSQGQSEFLQEVNILSKLRHPNLITLIGACPEVWGLVYEYLPHGSLEDRLNSKDNIPPLSWQSRIRIAAELCSVLLFLHSCRPQAIIHGDLKPSNILLDVNDVIKLSNSGIGHLITRDEFSGNDTILSCRTNARGTFPYVDPKFLVTGELTSKSDVYSFGVILLRLLTGKPSMGIMTEVRYALEQGNLKDFLDPAAGDWPFVQAKQLAHLGISCCSNDGINRPRLDYEISRVLEPMRASCGGSASWFGSENSSPMPSHFICPIFQETMEDPVVAADGFTYEAEALKGWLDSGHDTSPMTNLKLEHTNLVPNRALRSAIQERLQQHP